MIDGGDNIKEMAILAHEGIHLFLSLLVGIFCSYIYKNRRLLLVALVFGIFIDIDHWFDYFSYFGFKINLTNFFNVTTYMKPAGKTYVLFHGWEYLFPLFFLAKYLEKKWALRGLVICSVLSYGCHLLWDSLNIGCCPLVYFIIYRFWNNFNLKSFI